MVYINALMLQEVLAEPAWGLSMNEEDRRGLTPLFYAHVNPYGEFKLNMEESQEVYFLRHTLMTATATGSQPYPPPSFRD
jgi:hypothetical protein